MDEPNLYCPRLLICRSIWYDGRHTERGFSLGGLYANVAPPEGDGYPFRIERLFVYAQLWGDVGEYSVRIRFVRIELQGYDEEIEVQLGDDGEARVYPMPTHRPVTVGDRNRIEEFAFAIGPVPFTAPGLYEFQLRVDGLDHPVGRERIEAHEE